MQKSCKIGTKIHTRMVYQMACIDALLVGAYYLDGTDCASILCAGSAAWRQRASGSSGDRALDEDAHAEQTAALDRAGRNRVSLRRDACLSLWSAATPN